VEIQQAKIYHPHTPRQYLLPWADSDERVAWYGYGKVMRSGLRVVGGEDNFYELKELTAPDVDCMKLFIDGLPELGRKGHKRFLQIQSPALSGSQYDHAGPRLRGPRRWRRVRAAIRVSLSKTGRALQASDRRFAPY
jgi:hypothetical protein